MAIVKSDYIIFGAGMYGLYASLQLLKKGLSISLVEFDAEPFRRASYINQARLHNGYHYPRSYATAIKSARYFARFNEDFNIAVNDSFRKIYAISSCYSLTSGEQFEKFCSYAKIPCKPIGKTEFFNNDLIDGVYETVEYAYDARIIRDYLLDSIKNTSSSIKYYYGCRAREAVTNGNTYRVTLDNGEILEAHSVLNATYSSVNQVNKLFGFEPYSIKYEICEIILGKTSKNISNVGLTVMDGPFFSMMPFGKTGLHSLTSVAFTPHRTCHGSFPSFSCQEKNINCTPDCLQNCNDCNARPESAWRYMSQVAKKFLHEDIKYIYSDSLFSMKPILASSELDDSRPTQVRVLSENPRFISVLSGKINTVYDLEEVL